jgi:hypothetical protein
MSIIDTTHVDISAKTSQAPPAAAPTEDKAPGDGGDNGGKSQDARPQTNDLISTILDKHGLSSPEELADFVDRIAELQGQIGDHDPEELLKAKTTLDAYQREWARREQVKLKESETPEQTVARLEKELAERDRKSMDSDGKRKQAETAKRAVKGYVDVIGATIAAEKVVPTAYVPFLKKFLGVGSPVNDVNIQDRAAVKKMAREFGVKEVMDFAQLVIKDYREGKTTIPIVPEGGGADPVVADPKPKNLTEARALAHTSLRALFGKK